MTTLKRYLFLDVDGVLNHGKTSLTEPAHEDFPSAFHRLDRECIQNLNRLIEAAACNVVLSSTWRQRARGHGKTQRALRAFGYAGTLYSVTPSLDAPPAIRRGAEIAAWMHSAGVQLDQVVILDDEDTMGPLLQQRLVLCDAFAGGLTPERVTQALALWGIK